MLATALRAEADAFVEQYAEEIRPDGRQRVVRHGYGPERSIQTGIGALDMRRPKVRDRAADVTDEEKIRFTSAILPKWAPRSRSLDALLPVLYLRVIPEACLRHDGEDVSELLDSEPSSAIGPRTMASAAQIKVIEVARVKKSCRRCEAMVQGEPWCAIGASTMASAPSRPIPRSMAGPSLLAFILVSKFDDHVPLYRLNEFFARMGADIPDTTMVDWVKTGPEGIEPSSGRFGGMNARSAGHGGAMKALNPLIEKIEADVMSSSILHADDTPIRVLDRSRKDKGLGKGVKQGRIWAYVRDQQPWSGTAPPGVVYYFSPDRKGEHPRGHLANTEGVLQADAYAGFKDLYERRADGTQQFLKPPAGRTSGATSMTSGRPTSPK